MLLLHISDIHFRFNEIIGPDDPNRGLRNDLIHDVRGMRDKIAGNVEMILLSGDIAFAGHEKEYEFAYEWLEKELCPAAACAIENVFVIPGNHDVDVKAEAGPASMHARASLRATAADKLDAELRKWLRDPGSANVIFKPIENYNRFAARFQCSIGPYTLTKDGTIAKDSAHPFTTRDLKLNDGSVLRLWGFNSVIVSDLSDKKDEMLVDPAAAQIEREDGVTHLVMCHHPFNWLRNGKPFEDRIDAVAKIHLFGHEHTLRVDEGKHFVRIRAGAMQPARDERSWKPGYNWIDVSVAEAEQKRSLTVKIWVRMHETDRFLAVPDRNDNDIWHEQFDLPSWELPTAMPPGSVVAKPAKTPAAVPEPQPAAGRIEEVPMTPPVPSVTLRTVTVKFFKLKEHEQRRLIAKMKLDRDGDRDLKDYELATTAVRRASDGGMLDVLDSAIEALLSQGGR
ncbi:MAG: metallophosphoesterase [Xanthobacteraceae bacterium]|nr:metallophosphoesterase [Xanthobacteraceae bacterium]